MTDMHLRFLLRYQIMRGRIVIVSTCGSADLVSPLCIFTRAAESRSRALVHELYVDGGQHDVLARQRSLSFDITKAQR